MFIAGNTIAMYVSAVWLLVVILSCFEGKAAETTCENTGLGEPARVTCHFDQNVVKARDVSAVLLQRFPLNGTDGKQEMVVECRRFRNEEFDCLVETDYTINGTLSDQLITNIPRARTELQGKYYCVIVRLHIIIQGDSCVLEYKAHDHSTTSAPPTEQNRDVHLIGDTGTRHVSASSLSMIALILVLLVVAVLVCAVVLIFLWRRRRRRFHEARQQVTDVEKTGIGLDSFVPVFNIRNCNDLRWMNFNKLPYTCTEVKDSPLVSTGDNVGMAARRPYSSETYLPAENTHFLTEDNSQCGDYKSRWVMYNGDFEKS